MPINLSPHVQRQISKFEDLWNETLQSWPPPGFAVDKHTRKTWGLIALPENKAWHNVCDIIEVIAKTWPWHTSYALPQLHITIAGLGDPSSWKTNEEILHAILRQITAQQESIEVDFCGLSILRNTIIVKIIDKNNSFKAFVEKVIQLVSEAGLSRNLKIGIHNELWWTSIVRLYKPIPDEILTFVDSFKDIFLGSTILSSIHLIENNKTHDPLAVKVIESYDFLKTLDKSQ